jgi:hypothetical protein
MAKDKSSTWQGCFMPISQTEYFVEEKTAEEECLTEMPNVCACHGYTLMHSDFCFTRVGTPDLIDVHVFRLWFWLIRFGLITFPVPIHT